jgi:signal peptidase I
MLDEPYLPSAGQDARTLDCGAPVTVPSGTLFVLGDHRVVSQDSRHWGPIPESTVDGRLLTSVWPLSRAPPRRARVHRGRRRLDLDSVGK